MISATLSKLNTNTNARILILGNGYVGKKLNKNLADRGYDVDLIGSSTINYHDNKTLWRYLVETGPQLVINCSGFTGRPNVDEGESKKEECWYYNVTSPLACAALCNKLGLKYIQISSGCIYNGYDKSFKEDDVPNFGLFDESSFYSKSKHTFETVASPFNIKILRIRMPMSSVYDSRSYLSKIVKYDNIIDMKNSKTCIEELGNFIFALINDPYVSWDNTDIYNVANSEPLDTFGVVELLREYGVENPNWSFVNLEDLEIVAPRSNCILDTRKADKIYELPTESESIRKILENDKGKA